ncbi:MAG TPA: class I SAM-dependent methyltransferase [Geobacteraceae bacterium]
MKEFWDARYGEAAYAYGTAPNAFFASFLQDRPPGRLLLPAEGEGRNAVHAARLGWQVEACDYSSAGRDKALQLAAAAGVTFDYRLVDLADFMPAVAAYDLVACIYLHLPSALRTTVHRHLAAAVAPGGHLILEAFAKEQQPLPSGGPKDADLLYNLAELRSDFGELTIITADQTEIVLHEGMYHEGPSQVLRIVARRESM